MKNLNSSHGVLFVIGLGYVGLSLAVEAATSGWRVVGFDTSKTHVDDLAGGNSYVDGVSSSLVEACVESGSLTVTTDPTGVKFDVCIIAVSSADSQVGPDTSRIGEAAERVARLVRSGNLVVLQSTCYPGTTEEVVQPLIDGISKLTCGADYFLGYSPERIDLGNSDFGISNTPKVVSGVTAECAVRVSEFYSTFVSEVVPVSCTRTAEFVKLIENAHRLINISFVNELMIYARAVGLDIGEALDAAATKPFGYTAYEPGPGAGGHCLPKDARLLVWHALNSAGVDLSLARSALEVNDNVTDYVLARVRELLSKIGVTVSESCILIAGLSYKKNSSDPRGSASLKVIENLAVAGASVVVYDPLVTTSLPIIRRISREDVSRADVVVVLADHDALDYALLSSAGALQISREDKSGR